MASRVRELVELGLVVEEAAGSATGGRPAGRLHVHPAGGVVLPASIGASLPGVSDYAGRTSWEAVRFVAGQRGGGDSNP